jgi:hypothetical protein
MAASTKRQAASKDGGFKQNDGSFKMSASTRGSFKKTPASKKTAASK